MNPLEGTPPADRQCRIRSVRLDLSGSFIESAAAAARADAMTLSRSLVAERR